MNCSYGYKQLYLTTDHILRCEVPTTVSKITAVFWDMMQHNLVDGNHISEQHDASIFCVDEGSRYLQMLVPIYQTDGVLSKSTKNLQRALVMLWRSQNSTLSAVPISWVGQLGIQCLIPCWGRVFSSTVNYDNSEVHLTYCPQAIGGRNEKAPKE